MATDFKLLDESGWYVVIIFINSPDSGLLDFMKFHQNTWENVHSFLIFGNLERMR